ncbi:signal peptide peptidase SppA, 36K type [Thermodesulfobacterium geofontis OPF15]|uniref:Signal peptide peptidase SppA, 36K type n=1 Tax=Thermodesulfobacterium geofontis (strain OPF15) TaxID=795359 RepID=F8C5F9_THEGP|nr:signal peptide peptidase SppA [Thermodesulfobacterium geofontis]AEH22934.1 signal peptide peptidase SppA, 36K type [Thermodesulfobacterium geofontis OPF15]
MKRPWLVYGLAFIGGLVVFLVLLSFLLSFIMFFKEKDFGKPQIGVLEIKGVILDAEEYLMAINAMAKDRSIKAIVVRIDSPGGSVGASQEIFEELKKTRMKKPVIVSMGSVAASGGLYVSLGGTKIFASPGTVTGSIGVVLEIPNIEKLLKKVGVETETIKSGAYKDTGSIYRPLTPEEKEYLREKVKLIHDQFIKAISEERKIPIEKVKEFADGRIFTGEEALSLGLVDELGNFWDAVNEAKKLAKITEAKLVFLPKKKGFLSKILEEKGSSILESIFLKPWYIAVN